MTCSRSPGTGMPQLKLVRLMERSRRPLRTNEITSLRRVSGRMKFGLLVVELEQLVLEGRELEEVVLFADGFGDAPAVGAGRAGRRVHIQLVGDAVLAGVGALVDESAVAERRKSFCTPRLWRSSVVRMKSS